jgi:hypothetical protein
VARRVGKGQSAGIRPVVARREEDSNSDVTAGGLFWAVGSVIVVIG